MGVEKRTVQRNLKALRDGGWLRHVKIPGVRRAFEIAFPSDIVLDGKDDKTVAEEPIKATKVSREHDKSDAPYKNQGDNQVKARQVTASMSYLLLAAQEVSSEWKSWISVNIDCDVDQMIAWLTTSGMVCLPSRFPETEKHQSYMTFFESVISSKGACLRT